MFNTKITLLTLRFFTGVSEENRKLAKESKAIFQLVKTGANDYTLITDVSTRTLETKFVLNQETERTTLDGRKVQNTFTVEGNKLIERQVEPNREVTTIRIFSDSELVVESSVGAIRSKILCKLVE